MVNNDRENLKKFWSRYSGQADINAMMLNQNAGDIEEADRHDIMSSLPSVDGKDVVDIGAGIGRFTTAFAKSANLVISTDFIDEFIRVNREANGHLANVEFQVNDAAHLELQKNGFDLVFTNWLMMYLDEGEVVDFLLKAIEWIRPDGHLKLRESCSEPSTARTAANTMHDTTEANPTYYRYSSLYINLLNAIRYKDAEGKVWKYQIEWGCSVPTYITRQFNWRQVHWLATKVEADQNDVVLDATQLLHLFADVWVEEQRATDKINDNVDALWSDKIIVDALRDGGIQPLDKVFSFNGPASEYGVTVNSHAMVYELKAKMWSNECNPYYFRSSLTKANVVRDPNAYFSWTADFGKTAKVLVDRHQSFKYFVGINVLSQVTVEELNNIKGIFGPDSHFYFLEGHDASEEKKFAATVEELKQKLGQDIAVSDHTETAHHEVKSLDSNADFVDQVITKKWSLVSGKFH
uniref:Methyltransf_25 domain-containing protein n=1 Tax=Rhabditophanes sp. KR3021 TaxID=114890 RepID=A0AC35U6C0_9BILA